MADRGAEEGGAMVRPVGDAAHHPGASADEAQASERPITQDAAHLDPLAPLQAFSADVIRRRGRPRSDDAARRIRLAFRQELMERGFAALRLEHVAARAGVGKSTIYRHWGTKQALALDVLLELAAPHIVVPDTGDTRAELLATVSHPLHAITRTDFGPVIRALLSQIAIDPRLGDPFRASVVRARRDEVARVILRGIARGDLRPEVDLDVATELLVGPTYFRLMFGGTLDHDFAERIVDSVMTGYAAPPRGRASGP